ncbi:hypothetical protein BXO88_10900 [Oribacterium sp. C9]|uniref:hypothetical protein n=1 Tax=Oribacterium sp. C9 TaxID=1943579 RepID=UPI00098F440A|nr:hypothetical protein [Oribacterium sp. C9]OON85758.1 hypothetical protein BXO88_10900 [Oribacterium sp. C9]
MDSTLIRNEILCYTYDEKYKKIKWLDLYCKDKAVFFRKLKSGEVSPDTVLFFEMSQQKLDEIKDSVSIAFFREQKCLELIDDFVSNQEELANKQEKSTIKPKKEENLGKCSIEEYKGQKFTVFTVGKGKLVKCSCCGKNCDKYGEYEKLQGLACVKCIHKNIDGKSLIEKIKTARKTIVPSSYINNLIQQTHRGKLKWVAKVANDAGIEYANYVSTDVKKRKTISLIRIISDSGKRYVLKEDNNVQKLYGLEELEKEIIKTDPQVVRVKVHKKTAEEREAEIEALRLKKEEEKREEAKKKAEAERLELERIERKKEKAEQSRLQEEEEEEAKKRKEIARERQRKLQEELAALPQIGIRDFVVRRSVFKCMHNNHKIENIVAAVSIIDNQNEERLARINAGFCPVCKVYFVMESSYDNLKKMGIPLCRMSDEKTYLKNYSINGMMLAQESILMQYNYNVSQVEGLTSARRQKILAVLIDKGILSKSEIISYIDFFISQRQYQSKYQIAISKWEMDREFVENYRIGEYHQYGINAIYRK